MKTYFICLCVIIGGNWADAATQTSLNQDKPPRLYVKGYSLTDNGNEAEHDYNPPGYDNWGNIVFPAVTSDYNSAFNETINFSDGVAGTGSRIFESHSVNTLGLDETINDDIEWSWGANLWPYLQGTNTETYTDSMFPGLDSTNTVAGDPLIMQEHCDINVSDDTYNQNGLSYETLHTTEQRNAQTAMKLQTGGKAIPGSRSLIRISASASNFPPQSITIGNYGALNANGIKYITLNSGDDVDVTPYVAAADNYQFSVGESEVQTKADWQAVVQYDIDNDSGVKIENYLASNGFLTNRPNIQAVYAFYQKLFTEQPSEFYWCGLAKLAGAPVYAGLSDAEYCKDGFITSGFLTLGITGSLASLAAQFQNDLVQMNIAIYSDLAWQFEAYRKCGLNALEKVNADEPNAFDIDPWREIDQGIQQNVVTNIQSGNRDLLQREQQQILAQGYSDLNNLFPGTTSLMSILAQNPIIGGPSFSSLEPTGNLGDYPARWDWITQPYTNDTKTGMLPLWLQESPSTRLSDVSQPLLTRALQFSIAYTLNNSWTLY